MANLSTSSILNKNIQDFHDEYKNLIFSLPFSEQDVLVLQETFVTLGIHTIKTKNVSEGRKIIKTILDSLNYYHNIGSVTTEAGLPTTVCDIVNHIKLQKSQNYNLLVDLEDFFAIHPCFDFIWIELTPSIKNQYSLQDIKNIFDMYHAQERMTVLIVMYEEE